MPEGWRRVEVSILRLFHLSGLAPERAFFLWTVLVGAACGLAAVSFHLSIDWVTRQLFGTPSPAYGSVGLLSLLLVPALGALVAGVFLEYLAPEARGSGIPQAKTAYFAHNGFIPLRSTLANFLLSALQVGSGSSVGRQGPTVHICAGLASLVGRMLSLPRERVRSLLPVGAAAGFAAAFNAPLAAVAFALEEIVGDLNARLLGSIVLASVTAALVERAILGDTPFFHVRTYQLVHPAELGAYALMGLLAGLVSVAFCKGLLSVRARFKDLRGLRAVGVTAAGGLFVGLVALFRPEVMGVGFDTVNLALDGKLGLGILAALVVLKLAATAVSYGTGAAGGLFAPSLFLGAMTGGTVGWAVHALFPSSTASYGAYALVGMGALFAGVLRAPITSVLLIFEATQDYLIVLPLMVANAVSFALSRRFMRDSIFRSLALQDGVDLPSEDTRHLLEEIRVEDAMVREVVALPDSLTVAEAVRLVRETPYSGFPMVDEGGSLAGMVSAWDLKRAVARGETERPIREVGTTQNVLHAHPDQTLDLVLHKLGARNVSRLPVVSRADPRRLLGIIAAEDVMRAFGLRSQVHSEEGAVVREEPVRLAERPAEEGRGD